ncbi:hypothetical protein O181_068492 [Austropuccinia psidii MF-1]|uniref:Uncharacterized protein n=1 Tax=Austropuccinia psidii MF-1 TaxID=1389203 RepID=A0A9Q3I6B9_9BASI|nr:hypothetical protein [Austropuccinia psidii MF-1]
MSSKLSELTDSSPSALPPSVVCGSGILSQLASSWHFDPGQTYDGYKVVEKPCHLPGSAAYKVRRYLWSKKDGPFGKELPVSEGPTPDSTSGYSDFGGRPIYSSSEVLISRINTEGVKRRRRITDSQPDPDAEGSDELDGEEVEVVNNPVGQKYSIYPSQPPSKRLQSRRIPSTPRNLQPTLTAIPTSLPHSSPSSSHTRPAINPEVRTSPIQQSRASPIVTSQKLQ